MIKLTDYGCNKVFSQVVEILSDVEALETEWFDQWKEVARVRREASLVYRWRKWRGKPQKSWKPSNYLVSGEMNTARLVFIPYDDQVIRLKNLEYKLASYFAQNCEEVSLSDDEVRALRLADKMLEDIRANIQRIKDKYELSDHK